MGTPTERFEDELRMRIARLRRQIDGRIHGIDRGVRRLLSWRSLVRRWPGRVTLAVLGGGLALLVGMRRGWPLRRLGERIVRRAAGKVGRRWWRRLRRFWTEPIAKSVPAKPDGADHG